MVNDLTELLSPKYMEIIGEFQARGGLFTRAVAKYDKIEKCK
ncbi:MAG TPA: hypothetical protein ENN27_05050 [Candidatus Atribacteria bacterium]|nr:hypothetical protein [Candidatus Atribacteria bacterium]